MRELFFLKFNNADVIQYVYLNQLIVDANGVLVLLKFLNQDFSKVDQVDELKTEYNFRNLAFY